MKKLAIILLVVCMAVTAIACGHKHTWVEATCTTPKTCSECGKTEGEALGHSWIEATCTEPRTCSVCGATDGAALGHSWIEATKTTPKTCSRCGKTEGDPLPPDPVFFAEYPKLRTPESVAGINFIKKTEDNYYKYSLGSDRNKAEELLTQYAQDVLLLDGYLISRYPGNSSYYAIYDGGTALTNIKGLIGFSQDGNDIILTIGFIK